MEILQNDEPLSTQLSSDERRTLEVEYRVAFEMFQMQNSQAWQTFAVVSTLALAGLAFVGQLKTGAAGRVTWPTTIAVGLAMTAILVGWLALANRWWAYAQAKLYRMREIELLLGMYLIREGDWLRKPLDKSKITQLTEHERAHYESLHKAFPQFPKFRWRQQVLTSIIVSALIFVWILFMMADVFALI